LIEYKEPTPEHPERRRLREGELMPDALGWFACGAVFSAVLLGWPWHPRFRRHIRLGRCQVSKDGNGNCLPVPPAPTPKGWINTRDSYRPPDYPLFTEGQVQRGNGRGRPSTEKPVIAVKPQFPPSRRIKEDFLP
jgi:hypothetical protein